MVDLRTAAQNSLNAMIKYYILVVAVLFCIALALRVVLKESKD